jgi:zinc transport system permease protein
MMEALQLPFFQRVLLAGLLAALACGVIGTYVVAKRITSLAGGLAHAAFGGVGLGFLLGVPPMAGATAFGVAAGLVVGLVYRRLRSSLDSVISMVWSVGMALGIAFVALAPGPAPDLQSYLFGSLLFAPWEYVRLVAALDAVLLLVVWLLYREFQAVTFDEEFAEIAGVPVEAVFLTLLGLTSLAIVTLIRVVGVILAIALLTIPAATARQWVDGLGRMMVLSSVLAGSCTTAGLFLSYGLSAGFGLSVPPGPLVVLLAAALFGVSSLARAIVRSRRRQGARP